MPRRKKAEIETSKLLGKLGQTFKNKNRVYVYQGVDVYTGKLKFIEFTYNSIGGVVHRERLFEGEEEFRHECLS